MVRLEARREAPGESDRIAERGDDAALRGNEDEILVRANLRHGRDHLGREAGGEGGEDRVVRLVAEQPVAEFADGQVLHGLERGSVVGVDDEPRHLVLLVGNERFVEEHSERHIGKQHLCRDALLVAARRASRRHVPGTHGRGLAHQLLQGAERPVLPGDLKCHRFHGGQGSV